MSCRVSTVLVRSFAMSLRRRKSRIAFSIDSLISKSPLRTTEHEHEHQQNTAAAEYANRESPYSNCERHDRSRYDESITRVPTIPRASMTSSLPAVPDVPSLSSVHGPLLRDTSSSFLSNPIFCPFGMLPTGGINPRPLSSSVSLTQMTVGSSSFHVPTSPLCLTSAADDRLAFGNPLSSWLVSGSGLTRPYSVTGAYHKTYRHI